jgi:hypothetical protein
VSPPRFFVLGAGRSGTSILQELLSMHPRLVVSHELRVLELAVLVGALVDAGGGPEVEERAPRSKLGLELGVRYVAALGAEQARSAGKPEAIYADKYPPYGEQIAYLDRLWPRAGFVHILRDGRDVVASALQAFVVDRGWRRSPEVPGVEALAEQWVRQVRTARAYGSRLPRERYLELRYEDLTRDPRSELARVLAFVGIDSGDALDAMAAKLRPGKTWRETASHDELSRFEQVAGASGLLAELGYPPTPLAPADAGFESTTAPWSAGHSSPRSWADLGERASGAGDARRASFAYLRAIRGRTKDPRGLVALLAAPARAESLFAAMAARTTDDPSLKEALATWMQARGLDPAAARAALGLGRAAAAERDRSGG